MEFIIASVVLTVLGVNLLVTIGYPAGTLFINYISRKSFNPLLWEKWKAARMDMSEEEVIVGQVVGYIVSCVIWVFVYFQVDPLRDGVIEFGPAMTSVYYCTLPVIAVSSLPFLRWLVDISRNLKIKSSTGDSEKLREMQEQLDELNNKLSK